MIDKKIEALHALGWTDDLIKHFMSQSFVEKHFPAEERLDSIFRNDAYKTNLLTLEYHNTETVFRHTCYM